VKGGWDNVFLVCFQRELSVVNQVSAPRLQERQYRNIFRKKTVYNVQKIPLK